MPDRFLEHETLFLSTLQASRGERRVAQGAVVVSVLLFAALAPLAQLQLPVLWAFIPAYESALIVTDLITATLLLNQFMTLRTPALFVLAAAYLFTAQMTAVHALTFPGLFSAGGLLGAGPQTTAWLYMFWHGGFPLFVCAYALLKRRDARPGSRPQTAGRIWPQTLALLAALALPVLLLSLLATRWAGWLPEIMDGHRYTPAMIGVVGAVWACSAAALALLWRARPHSVLDLWLMVVMVAWLIDIALSAVLNQGRFDVGFYAGRIYGLMAASFVLVVLLVESGLLYRQLVNLAAALQRITLQDGLTGVANRRAFDAALLNEWRRAQRHGHALSLLMIDIDHFKAYNDGHGHVEGDRCLRAVAGSLNAALQRASDLLARYGGEEFAALLPETDAAAAQRTAERLHAVVGRLAPMLGQAVSVSIGVATLLPAPGDPSDLLVRRADRALYAAKAAGRNRVEVASEAASSAEALA